MSFDPLRPPYRGVAQLPPLEPKEEMNDKPLILEDTDGDGKADGARSMPTICTPHRFQVLQRRLLIAQAPT